MGLRQTLLSAVERPQRFPYSMLERLAARGLLSERVCHRLLLVEKPQYAYGVQQAAMLGSALGHRGVTVIEFGVAGGNGLLAMAEHARRFGGQYGIEVDVVGFDNLTGLPRSQDVRDLPYVWSEGYYAMNEAALRARLAGTQLVLGDVAETLQAFLKGDLRHPIGFASFDLDYYSSTAAALRMFDFEREASMLPRVTAYFDDVGTIEWIGELAAISDFNNQHSNCKIGRLNGLRDAVPGYPLWADQMYEAHAFDHSAYSTLLSDPALHQMPLRS